MWGDIIPIVVISLIMVRILMVISKVVCVLTNSRTHSMKNKHENKNGETSWPEEETEAS